MVYLKSTNRYDWPLYSNTCVLVWLACPAVSRSTSIANQVLGKSTSFTLFRLFFSSSFHLTQKIKHCDTQVCACVCVLSCLFCPSNASPSGRPFSARLYMFYSPSCFVVSPAAAPICISNLSNTTTRHLLEGATTGHFDRISSLLSFFLFYYFPHRHIE